MNGAMILLNKILDWLAHVSKVTNAYWLATGGFTSLLGGIALYINAHPFLAGVLITLGASALIVAFVSYLFVPPDHSPHSRAAAWWYCLPFRRVSWRLGNLQVGSTRERSAVVYGFACSLKVNRGRVAPKRFSLECPSGRAITVKIQCGAKYATADAIDYLPAGPWFHCEGRILLNDALPDDGLTNHPTPDQFLSVIGEFDLVLAYDDRTFRRRYKRSELKRMIDLHGDEVWRHPPPQPVLKFI